MVSKKHILSDSLFTLVTLIVVFLVNLFLVEQFDTKTMTPMIFVLGVFLVSWRTQGYVFGIASSLLSVLAVNWAFTYPYWAFDLISPECISSAVVMLIVATMTGALTTRLKQQEKLKAEAEKERMRGNLLRAVSHDLRTPLTSIYGSCSVILENYDSISDERKRRLLKDIQTDSQWLNRMVENLLSVTRVDADTVRLSKHSTVLEELIDKSYHLVLGGLSKKKQKEIKAKAQKVVIKEIRFGPQTDDHDYNFKLKHAKGFLEEGAKVKAYVFFKGRSILFKEQGEVLLLRFANDLEDYGKVEMMPVLEGKRMTIMLAPKKQSK